MREGHDMQTFLIAVLGLLAVLAAGTASAVELRDAELVASGSPVLENGAGTVRLEDPRLGRVGPTILVPEPGALWQQGVAIGLLVLLKARRRHHTCSDASRRSTRSPDPVTT